MCLVVCRGTCIFIACKLLLFSFSSCVAKCLQYDFKGAQLSFTDGGLTDNMGIMPLLRRGVTDVIAMRATQALPSSTAEAFAAADDTIASLYGAAPDAETNRKLKVRFAAVTAVSSSEPSMTVS